eukprot:TRINITY_DN2458_c0_g1_i1.p1 TRINITY_DN2458_c0_g1~~TRINITY_DN2458_c0_g1_i1.p1  ORF type:complete len:430 (-),score=44.04 TRINITY_DN2458_c0_g1_i1:27-1316(-)
MKRGRTAGNEIPPKKTKFPAFTTVPLDIWEAIMSRCSLKLTLQLGSTNKALYDLCQRHCINHFAHVCCASDTFLAKFTHLTYLEIPSGFNLSHKTLERLTNLSTLNMQVYPTSDGVFLSSLTKLQKLQSISVLNFSCISMLTQLTSLSAIHLSTVETDDLSCLSNLRRISLDYVDRDLFCNIVKLTTLKSLRIQGGDFKPSLIDAITQLQDLRDLRIYHIPFSVASLLPKLTNLTSLDCRGLIGKDHVQYLLHLRKYTCGSREIDCNYISKLQNLESLNCSWIDIDFNVLQCLPKLTSLKNLTSSGDPSLLPAGLKNLSVYSSDLCLSCLTNLRKLEIYRKIDSTGFCTLTNLTSLVHISLDNSELVSLLPSLPNLTYILFEKIEVPDEIVARLPKITRVGRPVGPNTTPNYFDVQERILESEDSDDSW